MDGIIKLHLNPSIPCFIISHLENIPRIRARIGISIKGIECKNYSGNTRTRVFDFFNSLLVNSQILQGNRTRENPNITDFQQVRNSTDAVMEEPKVRIWSWPIFLGACHPRLCLGLRGCFHPWLQDPCISVRFSCFPCTKEQFSSLPNLTLQRKFLFWTYITGPAAFDHNHTSEPGMKLHQTKDQLNCSKFCAILRSVHNEGETNSDVCFDLTDRVRIIAFKNLNDEFAKSSKRQVNYPKKLEKWMLKMHALHKLNNSNESWQAMFEHLAAQGTVSEKKPNEAGHRCNDRFCQSRAGWKANQTRYASGSLRQYRNISTFKIQQIIHATRLPKARIRKRRLEILEKNTKPYFTLISVKKMFSTIWSRALPFLHEACARILPLPWACGWSQHLEVESWVLACPLGPSPTWSSPWYPTLPAKFDRKITYTCSYALLHQENKCSTGVYLTQHNVSDGTVDVVVHRASWRDHVPVLELHGLGTGSSQLATNNDLQFKFSFDQMGCRDIHKNLW